ncbi:MAG TPA: PAS domain-containing protein [Caulobacterales bacterium]|nr:PAS domain-containing protein [Caulobacterales bacterium]
MTLSDEPFHPDTRALLEYGKAIAAGRTPPTVNAADKLGDRLFVIDGVPDGRANFLTFGSELITLFKRDLRRTDMLDLFLPADRGLIRAFVAAVSSANQPGVVCTVAETECGVRVGVEILVTPLAKGVLSGERLLGLMQPLGGEGFLGEKAISRLRINSLFPPTARERVKPQPIRLVVSNT